MLGRSKEAAMAQPRTGQNGHHRPQDQSGFRAELSFLCLYFVILQSIDHISDVLSALVRCILGKIVLGILLKHEIVKIFSRKLNHQSLKGDLFLFLIIPECSHCIVSPFSTQGFVHFPFLTPGINFSLSLMCIFK